VNEHVENVCGSISFCRLYVKMYNYSKVENFYGLLLLKSVLVRLA